MCRVAPDHVRLSKGHRHTRGVPLQVVSPFVLDDAHCCQYEQEQDNLRVEEDWFAIMRELNAQETLDDRINAQEKG